MLWKRSKHNICSLWLINLFYHSKHSVGTWIDWLKLALLRLVKCLGSQEYIWITSSYKRKQHEDKLYIFSTTHHITFGQDGKIKQKPRDRESWTPHMHKSIPAGKKVNSQRHIQIQHKYKIHCVWLMLLFLVASLRNAAGALGWPSEWYIKVCVSLEKFCKGTSDSGARLSFHGFICCA